MRHSAAAHGPHDDRVPEGGHHASPQRRAAAGAKEVGDPAPTEEQYGEGDGQTVQEQHPGDVVEWIVRQAHARPVDEGVAPDHEACGNRHGQASATPRPAAVERETANRRGNHPQAEPLDPTRNFTGKSGCEPRDDAGGQPSRDRVHLAQIAKSIGKDEKQLIDEVEGDGGNQIGPGVPMGEVDEEHTETGADAAGERHHPHGEQRIAARLGDGIPGRVEQRREQEQRNDPPFECHRTTTRGSQSSGAMRSILAHLG